MPKAPWRAPPGAASPGIPPEILRTLNLEQPLTDVYISRASIRTCLNQAAVPMRVPVRLPGQPAYLPQAVKPVSDFGRIQIYVRQGVFLYAGGSTMSDEAVIAQTGPYQVELTEGQDYWYCRCGRSKTQPFCDGSHEGTSFVPMQFTVDHTGVFNICGCKATDDEPFCDGTHNVL